MKKWIIIVFSLFLLFLISCYFFIPEKIIVIRSISANANEKGVYRFLNIEANWQKWWPGSYSISDSLKTSFESGGYQFKKTNPLYNSFEITIEKGRNTQNSLLNIFPQGNDSIRIDWNTVVNTGTNPFSKIRHYFKARELSKSLDVVLAAMQKHISDVKHIYGIDIRKEKVKVEFLVSAKKSFSHYPTIRDIYEIVNQIKKYINQQQAKEEDYSMLNISASDSSHFEAQVAIPVNKQLANTDLFSSKWMLKNGNILVAEITGGKNVADSAMKKMDQYILDYEYSNVAIPFQSLVTDRMKEPDSSKWLTRIYYPIR